MFTIECEVCGAKSPGTMSSGLVPGWTSVTVVAKNGKSTTTFRCPIHLHEDAEPGRDIVVVL